MLDALRSARYLFFNRPIRARRPDIMATPVREADRLALRISRFSDAYLLCAGTPLGSQCCADGTL